MKGIPSGAAMAAISRWIDESKGYAGLDPEAHLRRRLGKINSESGEVEDALAALYGENPRKPEVTGTLLEVVDETLDVAVAALGAVEHMTGNWGSSIRLLAAKIDKVMNRVGLTPWVPPIPLPFEDEEPPATTIREALAEVGRLIEEAPPRARKPEVDAFLADLDEGRRRDFLTGVFITMHDVRREWLGGSQVALTVRQVEEKDRPGERYSMLLIGDPHVEINDAWVPEEWSTQQVAYHLLALAVDWLPIKAPA